MSSQQFWKPLYSDQTKDKQSRGSQFIFGQQPSAHPNGSSPVPPIASFPSSSKPPEHAWEQDPSPRPSLPPVRPPIPVLRAVCPPAKLAFEHLLSTPCLHHPTTRDTDGGRAAARYHQTQAGNTTFPPFPLSARRFLTPNHQKTENNLGTPRLKPRSRGSGTDAQR